MMEARRSPYFVFHADNFMFTGSSELKAAHNVFFQSRKPAEAYVQRYDLRRKSDPLVGKTIVSDTHLLIRGGKIPEVELDSFADAIAVYLNICLSFSPAYADGRNERAVKMIGADTKKPTLEIIFSFDAVKINHMF